MSYPAALASGVTAAARRLALQLATLDAKGIYTDVVREFTDFPQLLASAVGPFFKDFAPLGATLAELFIGPAPLKGHGVPDLADFVRRTTGGGYGGGAGGAGGVGGGGQKFAGEEGEFEQQYYVSPLEKKPSEVEIKIIESVFHELVDAGVIDQVEYEDSYDSILAAANEMNWQMRWKSETRVSKLIEAGREYFEDLKNSLGMKIITSEMKNRIVHAALMISKLLNEAFKQDSKTKPWNTFTAYHHWIKK